MVLTSKAPKIKAVCTDSLSLLLTSVLSCVPFCVFLPASYLSPRATLPTFGFISSPAEIFHQRCRFSTLSLLQWHCPFSMDICLRLSYSERNKLPFFYSWFLLSNPLYPFFFPSSQHILKISIFKIYFSVLGLSRSLCNLVSRLGMEPGPLHWEFRVLATGPPGKSPPAKVFLSVRINYPYWSPFQVSAAFYPLCSCFCDNNRMGSALSEVTGYFLPSQSSILPTLTASNSYYNKCYNGHSTHDK